MSATRAGESPWREYPLEEGETSSVSVGPLRIDLRREGDEVWIAWSRSTENGTPEPPTEWERWAAPGNAAVALRPALPSRALVVGPEKPLGLAPRTRARIYVRVPLVAQVVLGDGDPTVLLEVPTIVMSNTWWGDVMEGEMCYWLPTSARRAVGPEHFQPHLVVCPVLIDNQSSGVLEVAKSAVRVAHLSIFDAGGRLWADETTVHYSGSEEGSEIEMSGTAPPEATTAVLLVPPREPIPRGLRAKTFARLKSISGF